MDEKLTGSYYTPERLVEFMTNHALSRLQVDNIMEPSVGDGRFINNLCKYGFQIDAVEVDMAKIAALQGKYNDHVNLICDDYINYSLTCKKKYDLVIGNPPYVSKKLMNPEGRKLSAEIVNYFGLHESIFQNLWVSFILGSIKVLNSRGAIFFVLPFEFLQVQYAEKLRAFLETRFNTIEIITFEEKVFADIEQDVCLVYMSNEEDDKPYIKYTTVQDIQTMRIIFESTIMRNKPLKKWSNCILDDAEIETIEHIAHNFPVMNDFGEISPGIVTGANSFFIVDQTQSGKLESENKVLPIIQKSNDAYGKLIFSDADFLELRQKNLKVLLLNLNNVSSSCFSNSLHEYIKSGEEEEIHKRHKCSKRNRWYDVPNIKNGDLCFFRRFDSFPRIIVNESNLYATDVAYNIRMKDCYDKYSLAFCFYNSLTLVLCEYNGRFYGGGVQELMPSEFKNIHVPYKKVDKRKIKKLDSMLRSNVSYDHIIDYVDKEVLFLPDSQLKMLKSIRNRYLKRRLKK